MVPLLRAPSTAATKPYVYSQYPRKVDDASKPWKGNNPIHDARETFTHMGYSIRSKQWRYTEWARWNQSSLQPIWEQLAGTELYDHRRAPLFPTDFNVYENANLAGQAIYASVQQELSAALRAHFPSPADGPISPPRCIPDGACRGGHTQDECCSGAHHWTLHCGVYGRCGCVRSGECADSDGDCCTGSSQFTLECPGLRRCQGFELD